MVTLFKTVALVVLAGALALLGISIPAHVRSVDSSVIELAGQQGNSNLSKIEESLDAAYIGPAKRIAVATQAKSSTSQAFNLRAQELIERTPHYRISGGPDRTFHALLKLIQPRPSLTLTNPSVVSLILPRIERDALNSILLDSDNANVAALLTIRNLPTLTRLHPANHPAGAPYDSGILTLALLIEGGHFSPALAQSIGKLAEQANLGIQSSSTQIEDLAIATLSLGRKLEYRSLISLAEITSSLKDWQQMATLFRAEPTRIDSLFTTLVYNESVAPVFEYIANHPKTQSEDLDSALKSGPAAILHLIASDQPIYRPSPLAQQLEPLVSKVSVAPLVRLTTNQLDSAFFLKTLSLFLAGIAFASALGALWRGSLKLSNPVSRLNPAILARNAFTGVVFMVILWASYEPDLLKTHSNTPQSAGPRIEFAVASTLESIKSPIQSMQDLNQVTLLVLALFFIIQLVIYCFCLIKLREISKQSLSPSMKLKLLDNEENLFDFGLYVGLGGTVLALILVAVGIVEASLMAAYASTLFGILFTAMLKVFNLRGYRRKLILEAGSGNAGNNLMSDISL
jgi:hypothetical protein